MIAGILTTSPKSSFGVYFYLNDTIEGTVKDGFASKEAAEQFLAEYAMDTGTSMAAMGVE